MSVDVNPGDNLQTKTNAASAGETFVIKAGNHPRLSVNTPKGNNKYTFEGGVNCDGQRVEPTFCRPSGGTIGGVEFIGLDPLNPPSIHDYLVGSSDGVIDCTQGTCLNWRGTDLWIHHNGLIGAALGTGGMGAKGARGTIWTRVTSEDNDQYGFGGGGDPEGIQHIDCNARRNGHANHNANKGGSKFTGDKLVCRGTGPGKSEWIGNTGPNLWLDTGTADYLLECLTLEDGGKQGGYIEVAQRDHEPFSSYIGGRWYRCFTTRNGFGAQRQLMYDSGIVIGHSLRGEIDTCISYDDYKGFGGHQQDRHEPDELTSPLMELKHLWVHHNVVYTLSGSAGIAAGVASAGAEGHDGYDVTSSGANNKFDFNTYFVHSSFGSPFRFTGSMTWTQWRNAGHDSNGTFSNFSGTPPAQPAHPCAGGGEPPPPADQPTVRGRRRQFGRLAVAWEAEAERMAVAALHTGWENHVFQKRMREWQDFMDRIAA